MRNVYLRACSAGRQFWLCSRPGRRRRWLIRRHGADLLDGCVDAAPSFPGRSWGRLGLQDGVLRFDSSDYAWRVALSDLKRVEQSKAAPRALEIETFAGTTHFVAILDARLLADSPRKAIQLIQRTMREAPTPRPTLLTKAPR